MQIILVVGSHTLSLLRLLFNIQNKQDLHPRYWSPKPRKRCFFILVFLLNEARDNSCCILSWILFIYFYFFPFNWAKTQNGQCLKAKKKKLALPVTVAKGGL